MAARSGLCVPVMAEAKLRDGRQSGARETTAQSLALAAGRPDLQELSCQPASSNGVQWWQPLSCLGLHCASASAQTDARVCSHCVLN